MMNLRRLTLYLILGMVLVPASVLASPPKAWAYISWWLPDSWRKAPLAEFDRVLFFELRVNSNGDIFERNGWPEKWGDLRSAAKSSNTPIDLTLTLFDVAEFNNLFSSALATERLLNEAVTLASHSDVSGLQLDFEIYSFVTPEIIARYRVFVRELSKRLRMLSPSRQLSIFFTIGGQSQLYDSSTARQLNHVVLQGYDAHWKGSKVAGPLSPLSGNEAATWKKAVAQGLSLGIPRSRLLLTFPLYGYEWEVKGPTPRSEVIGNGVTTSFAPIADGLVPEIQFNVSDRVKKYGSNFDATSKSSYYQFKKRDGKFVEGWFEDSRSLKQKSDYLMEERLGGIAFFPLGYDDGLLVDSFVQIRDQKMKATAAGGK